MIQVPFANDCVGNMYPRFRPESFKLNVVYFPNIQIYGNTGFLLAGVMLYSLIAMSMAKGRKEIVKLLCDIPIRAQYIQVWLKHATCAFCYGVVFYVHSRGMPVRGSHLSQAVFMNSFPPSYTMYLTMRPV